ncbi:N-acetylglucosamine-6-phosphate deacetylase [Thalassotalea mangrovi]|uniref:N-acetylgalactosamine-6-phosphate deacetylase n=1 Tax=Thalassotalea mangrovi TaxID=2572245 RepID=A0A4U1B3T3_9GAMM|nr:N-acetylglucosamine-6-phosphate deacetylase [Thalassotalea mangrovi]TKB44547.1 N-acetylglucosamine-6-phosphate deacetylase [Thalassotalea mangrovi]
MLQRLQVSLFFDGEVLQSNCLVEILNGRIVHTEEISGIDAQAEQIQGLMAPGLIDVQVNGGGGALLNVAPSLETLDIMFNAHAQYGTTAMLPTLITDDVSVLEATADVISAALAMKKPGIIGVHFEGPHLSVPKKGVHNASYIRPISDREMAVFCRQDLGQVMVTLAPENVAPEDIERLVNCGVHVCLGHSNADFATVNQALQAGASGFTHLFNAMSAFQSREPGMVGAALLDDNSWCGLIVDGHHVHYDSARLAIKTKQPGKIILVTDAMSPVGTDEQSFDLLGARVLRDGDRLNATTGELAGSCLDMASAVRNTVQHLQIPREEALRMASLYPAQFLSIDKRYGHLKPGATADFVIFDDQLEVTQTWVNGARLV